MLVQVLLISGLAALPFTPEPASDRHAEVWASMVAAEADFRHDSVDVAQYGPPPGGPPRMQGPAAGPRGEGTSPGMPYLRGLALTEAQQDSIFNIMHAQAPQARDQMKQLHKARKALREVSRSVPFDESRATALAADIARAASSLALLRARTGAEIWKVLTPEQRQQAATMPWPRMHHGPFGGEGEGPRGPR
jgi:Spy/CpxP family protein refolding chaperone